MLKVHSIFNYTHTLTGAPKKIEFLNDPSTKRVLHPLVNSSTDLEFGVEEVLPGCEIPEHFHENNEEILFVYKGKGQ
jgi:quercetin dioxygenase-like cupin family protein